MLDECLHTKIELRKKYAEVRRLLPEKNIKSRLIAENLLKTLSKIKFNRVFIYISFNGEPDTFDVIKTLLSMGVEVAAPVCSRRTNEMEFYLIDNLSKITCGRFGIYEPPKINSNRVQIRNDDVCILPGLVFSPNGKRLGYGRGFYDRYLKNVDAQKIGLCYDVCLIEDFLTETFDVSVNMVVTENEIIECKQ